MKRPVDCAAFLKHLGLERYEDCLKRNLGPCCALEEMEGKLSTSSLSRMNIQDFDHQKVGEPSTRRDESLTWRCWWCSVAGRM